MQNIPTKRTSNSFSTNLFIGVDPGVKGAISMIEGVERSTFVDSRDCPLDDDGKPSAIHIAEICRQMIAGRRCRAVVEKMQSFGKFKRRFGLEKLTANAQQWVMALTMSGAEVDEVLPAKWMKAMIGRGLMGEDNRSRRFAFIRSQAKGLFPEAPINPSVVDHSDRAVSVLLADYARRNYRLNCLAGLTQ